jgi:hypothetical protein
MSQDKGIEMVLLDDISEQSVVDGIAMTHNEIDGTHKQLATGTSLDNERHIAMFEQSVDDMCNVSLCEKNTLPFGHKMQPQPSGSSHERDAQEQHYIGVDEHRAKHSHHDSRHAGRAYRRVLAKRLGR